MRRAKEWLLTIGGPCKCRPSLPIYDCNKCMTEWIIKIQLEAIEWTKKEIEENGTVPVEQWVAELQGRLGGSSNGE